MDIRYHIMRFSTDMEEKMRKHDHDRGESGWMNMDPKMLLEKLMDEVLELSDSMVGDNIDHNAIISECADVANYAMMITSIMRKKTYE